MNCASAGQSVKPEAASPQRAACGHPALFTWHCRTGYAPVETCLYCVLNTSQQFSALEQLERRKERQ